VARIVRKSRRMGFRPEVHFAMRSFRLHRIFALFVVLFVTAGLVLAQTATTGAVTGTVTDPSGAVLPGATITLRNLATGATQTATTNGQGSYQFTLLPPANYQVSATARGFQTTARTVAVSVGQATRSDFRLSVGAATQTVTVSSEAPLVQTNNGNISTTFTQQQIALVPNPGNDLTAITQTTPGAVMNTQSGYGNFETYGLPATSNLFTVNGMDNNDPFLNLNNSGATNLMLGKNDIQEATVVNNGYTGQYGRLAGANVNYVSKSGSNEWHGNAIYQWNGRVMNANNFFNNATGTPRPFDNANQWALSLGGPIIKDHTFFFVDQEGLRVVLPTNTPFNVPTPAFEAATLANLGATSPAQVPFYQTIFNLYNGAKGNPGAALPGGGCADLNPALVPGGICAVQLRSTAGNFTHEWLLTARVDQIIGSSDKFFARFGTDHGLQATYTDPVNPIFNAQSNQPQYQAQLQETHAFSAGSVNQFNGSFLWYSALFQPKNLSATLAAFPTTLSFAGSALASLGGLDFIWPQGRKITQYQFSDDFSTVHGAHTIGLGADFRRDLTNDYDFGILSSGTTISESMTDFFNGVATAFEQSFPTALNQPINLYNLGAYIQDQWAATRDLKLTLAFRLDHNSNPTCGHNCFARMILPFTYLNHDPTIPYNQVIQTGMGQAFAGYRHWAYEPRFGFAWTPFGMTGTVLRGGFGLFYDAFPATVADSFAENPPNENTFVVAGVPISPAAPGNMFASGAANNTAFLNGFASGGTLASISASTPAFVPPNFFTQDVIVDLPRYQEWNLELQHMLGANASFSLNYVGNHGVHESIANAGLNAFCPASACPGGFTGLPLAPADPRFGVITQLTTGANSNYNGLTASLRRQFTSGLQVQLSYTWSHALDWVSNGGLLPFNFTGNSVSGENVSILGPQDPFNIRRFNYGNADYDVRHYFSASYVYQVPFSDMFHWGPRQLWQGWQLSGTVFARSGLPTTVIDTAATGTLAGFNYGTAGGEAIFGNELNQDQTSPCGIRSSPCYSLTSFSPSTAAPTSFGNQIRNQFRGPRFFDMDLTVQKQTQIPGWEHGQLGLGIQFYNLLNHPNFDIPPADLANPSFGQVIHTVSVPTSILGAFLGGDASPRVIELTANLSF